MKMYTVRSMPKSRFLLALLILASSFPVLQAQEVHYSFANVQSTKAGPFGSLEFDVTISGSSEFTLGSGQLYLNYNPAAFGENALAKGNMIVTVPPGKDYLLEQKDNATGWAPTYTQPLDLKDNTASRVSIAFRQNVRGAHIDPNVGEKPRKLFHVRFQYAKAHFLGAHGICFEQGRPYDQQTFSACGPFDRGASGSPDCKNFPGTRISSEIFDCNPTPSPVLTAQKENPYDALLFPVPAKDFLQVNLNSADTHTIDLRLWDQQGKLAMISEQSLVKGQNTWKMDISSLPAGVYYLEFVGAQLNMTERFVVIE